MQLRSGRLWGNFDAIRLIWGS